MRTTLIALLICIGQTFAVDLYSQNARINLNMSNVTIKSVLAAIENQSDFYFMYEAHNVNVERKITVSAENKTVTEILNELFANTDITYKINNRQIALTVETSSLTGQQQKTVSGRVTDSTGAPLPGVTVVVKGTAQGIITDFDGKYSLLSVPANAMLMFSFVGMRTQEIATGGKTTINVILSEEAIGIEEVIAVGYQSVSKKSVTTSISSIKSKEMESYVTGNIANALQGKLSGILISPGSGLPGSQPTMIIRGLSSLTGSTTPLVIVDGNEIGYNSLNFINPSDIESIDVLKDASASAIYGSRGGQGVILITTKRGKGKPSINVQSSFGFDYLPDPNIASADEYMRVMNTIAQNSGVPLYFPNTENIKGTDYWNRSFDTGVTQNYNISATGSKEGLSFYGSLGYYKQDSYNATDKGGNWEKITARFNAEMDLSKIFKMGLSFSPRYEKSLSSPNNIQGAFVMDPTTPPLKTIEEVYASIPTGFMNFNAFNPIYSQPNRSAFANTANPEFNYLTNFGKSDLFGAEFSTYLQATPIKNLVLKTSIEGFATAINSSDYSPKYFQATNSYSQETTVSGSTQTNMRWKITNTANYKFDIQEHHFDILAGQSADNYIVKGTSVSRKDIPFDEEAYRYLSGAATLTDGTGYYQDGAARFGKMLSYFGSVRYNLKNRYYLSATMRTDASSLINPDYRWGYFPTLSTGWMISDEPFFKPLSNTISSMKLRASWGRAGGNLPTKVGAYLSLVSPINYPDALGGTITGYYPSEIANPEIKWEIQEDYTIGLDATLFKNKLNVTLEAYTRKPQNLLVDVTVDPALGYPQNYISVQPTNVGKLTTKGWDVVLNYKTNLSSKLKLGVDLTLSHFKSIADYAGNTDPVRYGVNNDVISTFRSRLTKGHEPGAWYGYVVDGVFQTDAQATAYVNKDGVLYQPLAKAGDLMYRDVTEDGKIDNDDLTDIGSPWPKLNTGLTITLNYGNFDFRTEFYSAIGHQYNNGYRLQMNATNHTNFMSGFADQFWSGEGSTNSFPILRFPDRNGNFSKMSSFLIEDADFVRCRLIQVGYTIPSSLISGIRSLRIYASAQNLFTITKYSGLNPDLPFQGIGLNGIDSFQAMQPRSFMFGLSLGL